MSVREDAGDAELRALAEPALQPMEDAYRAWGGEPEEHLPSDTALLEAIARHRTTPPDLLARLLPFVPDAVARNPSLPALLPRDTGWVLALGRDARFLLGSIDALAADVQPVLVATLLGHPDRELRADLADLPGVPFVVIERLALEDDEWIRNRVTRALHGRAVPPETLVRLLASPHLTIRVNAEIQLTKLPKDPATPPAWLAQLARAPEYWRRQAVASNPSTPPDVLATLAVDADDTVREAARRNPSMPAEVLAQLEDAELADLEDEEDED